MGPPPTSASSAGGCSGSCFWALKASVNLLDMANILLLHEHVQTFTNERVKRFDFLGGLAVRSGFLRGMARNHGTGKIHAVHQAYGTDFGSQVGNGFGGLVCF